MTPEVSVILPCYNHQAYVHAAVDSVLRQTVADVEVIAIDDASSDATPQILEAFDDPRLTLIRHASNQGSARTLNEGIRRARAPYIGILNSDDLFHPNRLAECLGAMRGTDTLLLGTDLDLVDARGEVIRDRSFWWVEWYRGLREIYRMTGDLTGTLIAGNIFCSTSNFFFDRRLFDGIGPLADHRYVQDYEFVLRAITAHPHQVVWLEKTLLSYRLHDRNTILEDQLVAAQQTLEILARWMPDLAVGERARSRLHQFEDHLLRLSKYIENGASTKVREALQADAAHLRARLQEDATAHQREADALRQERDRLLDRVADLDNDTGQLRRDVDALRVECASLAQQNAEVDQQNAEVAHQNAEVAQQNAEVAQQNADLLHEVARLRAQVEEIYASRSYRLGFGLLQPARWLLRIIRSAAPPR
jgi:glycosyltransferase involved in cell wall biosynthesis